MKNIYVLIAAVILSFKVSAQEEAVFTHYHISPILINPAAAGFSEKHELLVNARGSWTGFVDAPRTFNINYNGPMGDNFGVGIGLISESAAQLNHLRGRMNFAFRFPIKDKIKIAAGVAAEYEQLSLQSNVINGSFFQQGDRILESALDGQGDFDAAVSVYGTFLDRTFAGLVFTDLVQSKLDDIVTTNDQASFLNFFMFHVGHKFEIEDLKFTLTPSLLIRQIKDAPRQIDFNLKAGFLDEQLVAGLSYRQLGVMGVLLGTKLSNFYLYYSYDLSFQRFQQFNSGSHEVSLAFTLNRKSVPKKNERQQPSSNNNNAN